ncbi:MAG: hypothetical protein R6X34_00490 [Chloroflexota bacterium]
MFGYDTIFVIAVQACCQGLLFDLAGEETAVFPASANAHDITYL